MSEQRSGCIIIEAQARKWRGVVARALHAAGIELNSRSYLGVKEMRALGHGAYAQARYVFEATDEQFERAMSLIPAGAPVDAYHD